MASYKYYKTKYPGIYRYELKKGTRYAVRVPYTNSQGRPDEKSQAGIKTINEARAIKREIEEIVYEEKTSLLENRDITLDDWFEKYLEIKSYKPESYTHMNSIYNRYFRKTLGKYPLRKIDRLIYQREINKYKAKNLAQATIDTIHNVLMSILNEAVELEILERNRLRRVNKTNENAIERNKVMEPSTFKSFMDKAREMLPSQAFCMVSLTTWGLRRGEVNGIKKKSVTRISKECVKLTIDSTRTNKAPEGKGTKTPTSERSIIIKGETAELLLGSIREAENISSDHNRILHEDDFIFLNPATCKPYHISHLNRHFQTVRNELGIEAFPHMMRHTFVTQTRAQGASAVDVASFVGHKNISMTDHYTHSTADGIEKVVDLAQKRLNRA